MKIIGLTAIVLGVFLVQAQAHHSSSLFDKEKMITVSGTLKEFEWSNPHSWLHIVAVDPATGLNAEWAFEMSSVSVIAAQGWKVNSVKPGDKITISGHPLKDGSHGGRYRSVNSVSEYVEFRPLRTGLVNTERLTADNPDVLATSAGLFAQLGRKLFRPNVSCLEPGRRRPQPAE